MLREPIPVEECCTCGSKDCPQAIRQADLLNRVPTQQQLEAAKVWYEERKTAAQ